MGRSAGPPWRSPADPQFREVEGRALQVIELLLLFLGKNLDRLRIPIGPEILELAGPLFPIASLAEQITGFFLNVFGDRVDFLLLLLRKFERPDDIGVLERMAPRRLQPQLVETLALRGVENFGELGLKL